MLQSSLNLKMSLQWIWSLLVHELVHFTHQNDSLKLNIKTITKGLHWAPIQSGNHAYVLVLEIFFVDCRLLYGFRSYENAQ